MYLRRCSTARISWLVLTALMLAPWYALSAQPAYFFVYEDRFEAAEPGSSEQLDALLKMANVIWHYDVDRAIEVSARATELAQQAGNRDAEAASLMHQALWTAYKHGSESAREFFEEAKRKFDESGEPRFVAHFYAVRFGYSMLNEEEEYDPNRFLDRVGRIAEELNDPHLRLSYLYMSISSKVFIGKLPPTHPTIVALREELAPLAEEHGFESGPILLRLLKAQEARLNGNFDAAFQHFAEVESFATERQFRMWAMKAKLILGHLEMSQTYHAYVREHGPPAQLSDAQLSELRRLIAPVRSRYERALNLARKVKISAYIFEALIHLAFLEHHSGNGALAKQHLAEADTLPYECFRAWVLRDTLYRYAIMVFSDEPRKAIQYANRLVSEEHVSRADQASSKVSRYQQLLAAAEDEIRQEAARHRQAEGALAASRDLARADAGRLRATLMWVATILGIMSLTAALAWSRNRLRAVRLQLTDEKENARINREMRVVLQERVNRLQRMESLGMLAGGVAHDFNNLLVGVIGNAEILTAHGNGMDDMGKECVEQILASAEKAADLSRQMLAYAGKQQIRRKNLNINTVIGDLDRVLAATVGDTAELSIELGEEPLFADVDATQIEQVVLNLVSNARQACEQPKPIRSAQIRVRTGKETIDHVGADSHLHGTREAGGEFVYFEVIDSGPGFDTVELDRIFEPFYSVSSQGRGLGLSVVYGIVNGHDGLIRVRSTLAEGTLFRVLLPMVVNPVDGEDHANQSVDQPATSARTSDVAGTILVVDDEQTVRDLTASLLEMEGWNVLLAASGQAGLKAIDEAERIDCLLLDVTMPGMGAVEVLRNLQSSQVEIPVILMSGYSDTQLDSFRKNLQVSEILAKPFRAGELAAAIGRAVTHTFPKPQTHAHH